MMRLAAATGLAAGLHSHDYKSALSNHQWSGGSGFGILAPGPAPSPRRPAAAPAMFGWLQAPSDGSIRPGTVRYGAGDVPRHPSGRMEAYGGVWRRMERAGPKVYT